MNRESSNNRTGKSLAPKIFLAALAVVVVFILIQRHGISAYVLGHVAAISGDVKTAKKRWFDSHDRGLSWARPALESICVNRYGLKSTSIHWWTWCRNTIKMDEGDAFVIVAMSLLDPPVRDRDPALGLEILRHQAVNCNMNAAHVLGGCYGRGDCGLPKNPVLSLKWLRITAKYGSRIAVRRLMLAYGAFGPKSARPKIVEPNKIEGVKWWMIEQAYDGYPAEDPRRLLLYHEPRVLADAIVAEARRKADDWLYRYPPPKKGYHRCIPKQAPRQ